MRALPLLLLLAACSSTEEGSGEELPPRKESELDKIAWIAGHWVSIDESGRRVEEHWIEPDGGMMLGVSRTTGPGVRPQFEFLRIAHTPEGVIYYASPGGRPSTPFKLIETFADRAVFANPANDFPNRILYRLRTDGTLEVRIEGTQAGESASMDWTFRAE